RIAMAWLWARIHIRANSRDRGPGGEKLGYIRGGFAEVTRALEQALRQRGVRIERRAEVTALGEQPRCALVNGREESFDQCVFTGPCPALAKLLAPHPSCAEYVRNLESIAYLGAVCLVFVTEQDLGGPYWLNINEPGAPFLVCLQHTRLVDKAHYGSRHVYYLGAYQPHDGPAFTQPEDALVDSWWNYLRRIFPAFESGRVLERHLFRFKHAQHIVDLGYAKRIPTARTPLAGVSLANFAQVFPEDRGTNYAVREGRRIAAHVWEVLREDKRLATAEGREAGR